MTRSSALRPWQFAPRPDSPLGAFQCLRCERAARLSTPSSATRTTLPPSPPSPPSGPPRGTYFSRRKLRQPSPPLPACTWILTRSTNMRRLIRREHVYPAAAAVEFDVTVDESKQCVIVSLAYAF